MSGMFGGGASAAQQQQIYAGIQVSSSILGQPLPYVAGRQRVPFNLSWYGNFQVQTASSGGSKGGGGSGSKQYTYSTAFIAALCLGPITGIFQIWHDKALETLTSENLAIAYGGARFNGSISGTTLTVTAPVQGFVTNGSLTGILPGLVGGTVITGQISGTPGGAGQYTVSPSQTIGTVAMFAAQPSWSGYPSGTPAGQIIPYDHLAYVASSGYNLGSSAGMPDLTFEVEGVVPGFSDANGIFDADPSAVLPNYLLDGVIGALANYPGTPLIIGSSDAPLTGATNSFQSYCLAMGLLTSPYEYTQRQATDFTAEFLQCTNSDVFLSYGTLKVFPYCDQPVSAVVAGTTYSYTPNLTPVYILGPDDYIVDEGDEPQPPVKLHATAKSDTFNEVNVEYLDRANYYNAAPVTCSDDDDIAKYGPRLASALSWHQITVPTVAKTAGNLWLQKQLREVNRYEFKTRRDYSLLEPGIDFVALNTAQPIPGTNSGLGLVNQLCQVESVEVSDEDESLTFIVREIPGVTRSTAQFNWASAQGYFANYATDPGPVQAPLIFQMPPIPAAASKGINIGVAVAGQTANAAWLGCEVWASVDGGTTYQFVGIVPEACRYGTLTTNLPAVADPDTSSTLSLALANTNLQLSTAVTHADADSMQTLMMLYGGTAAEVMSYGSATLTSAGHYNLSYLRRSLYQTSDTVHSASNEGGSGLPANFVRLDGSLFQLAVDPGMAGQTLNFKFVSFNTWQQFGPQTLAGATAYSYTVPSGITVVGEFLAAGSCAAVETTAYKQAGSAAAWDSCVYSSQSFVNGCSLQCYPSYPGASSTNYRFMLGLTTNPLANLTGPLNHTNLNYAIYVNGSVLQIFELGALVGTFATSYTSSTLLQILYDGKHVQYLIGGVLVRSVPIANQTFFMQSCFFDPGAACYGLLFDSSTQVATPFTLVPMPPDNVAAAGTTVISNFGAANTFGIRNFQSAESYSNGCQVSCSVTASSTNNGQIGLSTAPATGGTVQGQNFTACFYTDIFHGDLYGYFGTTQVFVLAHTIASSDVLTLTYDNFTFRWWLNGTLLFQQYAPSEGPLFLFGDFLNNGVGYQNISFTPYGLVTPQIWTARGNAVISDEVIQKNGGSSAWDSDAISIVGYPTCHLMAVAGQSNHNAVIALNTGAPPTLAQLAALNLSYALVADSGGNLDIWESGSVVVSGAATYTSNDVLSIVYGGASVIYKINATTLRTVTVTTGVNMFGDVAIFDPSASFNNVEFGPGPLLPVTNTGKLAGNAATSTSTASLSAASVGSFTSPVTLGSITVGPFPFTTSVILTVTGQWQFAFSGGTSQNIVLRYGISPTTGTFTGALVTLDQSTAAVTGLNGLGPLSQEIEVSLAANTTTTYNVLAGESPSGIIGTAISVSGTIKAEVIKR